MNNPALAYAAAALVLLSGCATVTRGTSDVLVIESEPAGAEVEITPAGKQCKTPCSVKLKRKHMQLVTIRKQGFEEIHTEVNPQVAGAGAAGMAGNVVLGGLIGAAVDAGSGAMKDLKPNPVSVKLVPIALAPVAPAVPATSSVSNLQSKRDESEPSTTTSSPSVGPRL